MIQANCSSQSTKFKYNHPKSITNKNLNDFYARFTDLISVLHNNLQRKGRNMNNIWVGLSGVGREGYNCFSPIMAFVFGISCASPQSLRVYK